MKPTKHLLAGILLCSLIFTACKKENTEIITEPAIETTFELTADESTSEFMAEDDNDILMESAEDKGILGNFAPGPIEPDNFLPCATVTITPAIGFPKTIRMTFDSSCVSPRGIRRSGVVKVVISDTLRRPGSTSVMTFENYYVNRFKREGVHTWTNTSELGIRRWRRTVEGGKITAPNGRFWLHESVKVVTQTAGVGTPQRLDDVFSIRGNSSVTNPAGATRTAEIISPLQKKVSCANIDSGRIRFEGPNHFAILDYGNGDCDRIATISIDGRPPRTILLP